jgi:folate-binding protein YgfZ
MLETPLHSIESRNKAQFISWFGWEIPDHYGDPAREYQAILESVAVLDLCYAGKLLVTGRDRVRYLHNMLSNDIKNLRAGSGCYATLLTHQGRMESDLHVYALQESFLLECGPAGKDRLLQTLQKYIVGDVVEVVDRSTDWAMLSLQGPGSRAALEPYAGTSLGELEDLQLKTVPRNGADWHIIRHDRTGCGGFDLWIPAHQADAVWNDLTEELHLPPAGLQALNVLRTEAGIPWYGVDMDERNLPMEFGLDNAVSYNKGCYRGQEIVARVTQRGHLNRRIAAVALNAPSPPRREAPLTAGDESAGAVTSAVHSPRLGRPLALALLKIEFVQPGTMLEVTDGAEVYSGTVVQLPIE